MANPSVWTERNKKWRVNLFVTWVLVHLFFIVKLRQRHGDAVSKRKAKRQTRRKNKGGKAIGGICRSSQAVIQQQGGGATDFVQSLLSLAFTSLLAEQRSRKKDKKFLSTYRAVQIARKEKERRAWEKSNVLLTD